MRRIVLLLALAMAPMSANADFLRWSVEVDDDPFSGGTKVVANFMSTIRSGAFIFCDSTGEGLSIRVIPGYAHVEDLEGFEPQMEFAIDGVKLASVSGNTGSVGDNLAAAEAELIAGNARTFIKAFVAAKRQVAIKDGISVDPMLLKATGSTNAGGALLACLKKQPGWSGAAY